MANIVLIEDNKQNARLAEKLLHIAGHSVTVAETGEAGLNAVMAGTPELILVDLGLPDMDGQTVVAFLRQQTHLTHVPIIAFTAWPAEAAKAMAGAYGCDGVITKPISTANFAPEVQSYLEARIYRLNSAAGEC